MAARKIEDAGELVGGARKHSWGHGLTPDGLAGLSPEEAHAAVSKDAVWPTPDFAALITAGAEPEAMALVKVIRDRVAAKPSAKAADRFGVEAVRNGYVNVLSEVKRLCEAAKTIDDVKLVYGGIYEHIGYGDRGYANPALAAQLGALRTGSNDPFLVKAVDEMKARGMVAEGFPEKKSVPAWLRGVNFGRRRNGDVYAFKGREIIVDDLKDQAAVEAELHRRWSARNAEKDAGPKAPPLARHVPEDACREGMPDHRKGSDVSPQDFIDTFGFRAVQFGQAMPDPERQLVLNRSFDALHDLAQVLDIPLEGVSLNGFLAAAIGARGINAAAHYEGARRIYNLGRRNGSGCLAHEWLHAFDHYSFERSEMGGLTAGEIRFASDSGLVGELPEALVTAWPALMKTLKWQPRTLHDALAALDRDIAAQRVELAKQDEVFAAYVARGRVNLSFEQRVATWKSGVERTIAGWENKKTALSEGSNRDFGSKATAFRADAGEISGSGDYMRRPWELAARAFEAYVWDRVAALGGRSDFLVCGVEEDRYADKDLYKGNPYPAGEERRRFNAAFDELAVGMRELLRPDAGPGMAP